MSHIVEIKTKNYEKQFIVNSARLLKRYSIFKMVRFFLRSVYNTMYCI